MILLKRFMGWGIGSIQPCRKGILLKKSSNNSFLLRQSAHVFSSPPESGASPQFRTLSWRLLLSYLGAMVAVMGFSTIAMYHFFAYSLYQELDHQLGILAEAATHNLTGIRANRAAVNSKMPQTFDNDGDLDIPWQDLGIRDRSVEWFDANRQLLGKTGKQFSQMPLAIHLQIEQQKGMRVLTVPVYESESAAIKPQLQGYVRVSASTNEVEQDLNRLLAGMGVGGAIAIVLIGGTGWWLTRRSLQPIEQSVQQLKQFTADASHELRSPLTAIRTAVEVMQSHPERIHPTDVQKVAAIASATRQMTHLVEDLLLLARADATPATLSTTAIPIPINEVLEDLLEAWTPQAIAKGIFLQASEFGEVWVKGDAAQLRRLFSNLLDNGIKYTPPGGKVSVTIATDGSMVAIAFADTGIGLTPDQIPRVFDRFWRADRARSRHEGGSGLGLAIAVAIAHAHGGEITVTSQVNLGSCFQVYLPKI